MENSNTLFATAVPKEVFESKSIGFVPGFARNKILKLICDSKIETEPEHIEWEKTKKGHYVFTCYMIVENTELVKFKGKINPNKRRAKGQRYYLADITDCSGTTVNDARVVFNETKQPPNLLYMN